MSDEKTLKALLNAHPRLTIVAANARLEEQHPVWLLRQDGILVAANSLALWFWGGIQPDKTVNPDALLGVSAFDIFTRNLSRIAHIPRNSRFLLRKSQVDKRLALAFPDAPPSSFCKAMQSDPRLASIYSMANPDELSDVWQYELEIVNPSAHRPVERLLEVQTTVSAVYDDETPVGFLAVYQPTSTATSRVFSYQLALLTTQGAPYVWFWEPTSDTEERRPEASCGMANPSPTPESHVSSLQDLNDRFALRDALLDDGIKAKYPVVSLDEINRRYPGQWVAVATVAVGPGGRIVEGRVFDSAPRLRILQEKMRSLRSEYPGVALVGHFTGEDTHAGQPGHEGHLRSRADIKQKSA